MNSKEEQVRTAIAEEAGEWFVANEDRQLDEQNSGALATWLRSSPIHVEEFLGVASIARDLKEARGDPAYSLEAILARSLAQNGPEVRPPELPVIASNRNHSAGRWLNISAAITACAALSIGLFLAWDKKPFTHSRTADSAAVLHIATRHGEQLTYRLADHSVVHLNTDSAATVQYSANERLVILTKGQAEFEIAHESERAFRVIAGSAEVIDLGTKFDVRLQPEATVVTVLEGGVKVGPAPTLKSGATSNQSREARFLRLGADQQIRTHENGAAEAPVTVDAQNITAWLRREIVVEHETLEQVAAEYNRYATKQFEIVTPELRNLRISGVFATDDADAFIAFLRSLKGVHVEVTEMRIRVSRTGPRSTVL